jgi:uncharacterized Zn finger protein
MRTTVTILCPNCQSEDVQPRTKNDQPGYDRIWIDTACQSCGHVLTFEDYGKKLVQQSALPIDDT